MAVEATCLLYFIFRICHHAHWSGKKSFKKDLKMMIAIVCIIVSVFVFLVSLEEIRAKISTCVDLVLKLLQPIIPESSS